MTGKQIQKNILEKLEEQGYQVDLAESKENNNVIIIEDLREFLKSQENPQSLRQIEKDIESINKNFELFQNCRLLRYISNNLINCHLLENNIFKVIGFQEKTEHALDLIIYINGIPLITWKIGEANESLGSIYEQLFKDCQNFQQIYSFNAFSLISEGLKAVRYGIPWVRNELNNSWGWEWKDLQGRDLCFKGTTIDYVIENLLNKRTLISIIKNFICFSNDRYKEKKICLYQQFYLASKFEQEINSCIKRSRQHAGVQKVVPRSGRAHILLFLCKLLVPKQKPIIVFSDRKDVRSKLFKTFENYKIFLGISEIFEINTKDFYYRNYNYSQILFTDINCLRGIDEVICQDEVICIFYEVGSRKYTVGIQHKTDKMDNEISIIPRMDRLKMYLPNAIFLEIASDIKTNSRDIFGRVHDDEYQLSDLIRDGIAMKCNYEDRSISVKQNSVFAGGGKMQDETRAKKIIKDIVKHYEDRVLSKNSTGKAMILFGNRKSAMAAYRALREIRPNWFSKKFNEESKVHLIMPQESKDKKIFLNWDDQKISFFDLVGSDAHREELKISFAEENSRFQIAIAVGLLVRGFTNNLLDTIYLDRSPPPTFLKQIITRVNGKTDRKTSSLIVSYNSAATKALKRLWKEQLQFLRTDQLNTQFQ